MKVARTKEGLYQASFYSPLYRFTIDLIWNSGWKACEEYVKRVYEMEIPTRPCNGMYIQIMNGDDTECAHLIYLRRFTKTPRGHAVLVHESLHATEAILSQRGVNFQKDAPNEAFAYLQEFIAEECMKFLYASRK